jgi:alkaline phosphatase D
MNPNPPYYCLTNSRRMNRRTFLAATSSLATAALWSSRALANIVAAPKFAGYPFTLGVASGDPTSSGVVIWTRLAPKPLEDGGMPPEDIQVRWKVADDEAMNKVVAEGTTVANPEWAHSVHVEVDGLRPDRWYWYQFEAGNESSPKGRTRTMPPPDAVPDRLRFAFASCQHFEAGYYTAYEHMVREDLDLVVHLGDYIYEGRRQFYRVRRHIGGATVSLDDYRRRYALYKSDPALKAMHAAAPWIVTWDDHEVENNYAADIREKKGADRGQFLQRRAAAYKAYYEHMPLRRSALPKGPDLTLYRQLAFGRLASFNMLDTRQYRSDQPCGGGRKPQCPEALSPDRTILGANQRKWLFDSLGESSAKWNILAQQVMMARVDRDYGPKEAYAMDQWPGYESDRRQVLKFFRERKIANPVVLTGDIHSNWANELIADFDDLGSQCVATEFVGTSISSGGNGRVKPADLDRIQSANPFVKFHNAERGYVRCEVTPGHWRTDYRVVEFVTRPGAAIHTRASFTVEAGRAKLQA